MAAALLGVFGAAEGAGAPTTGSRTSTSGSLVLGHGGSNSGASDENLAITSSLAGTYTEAIQDRLQSGAVHYYLALSYNIGGTRGASHTLSMNDSGGNSLGGTEWSGIAASPTVDVGTASSGSSTTPSASVTVTGGAALVVGVCGYGGTATTIAVSDGTEAQEIDEDQSRASQNVAYKITQTGTVTISWTLGASRDWHAFAVAFTEDGGASSSILRQMMNYHGG